MPPKKKKGRGSATAKSNKVAEKTKEDPVSEGTKAFYLLQIRDLEGRLERYEKKCDEVYAREKLHQDQYDQLVSDRKDIVTFLKRTLNERIDEIADLRDQLADVQQARDAEKEACNARLAQMHHELQETRDRLSSENMLLAGKLAALEEFRVQKEELMDNFSALEEKLQKQEEGHRESLYKLEKKAVLDKERLKKEVVERVNTVASEFRKASNDQMAETTKRAIRENAGLRAQLTKMAERSEELICENELLNDRESELKREVQMLEENEKVLARKHISNQKIISMLTEKYKQQAENLNLATQKNNELIQLQMKNQTLLEETQALRDRMASLEKEVTNLNQEKDQMIARLEDESRKRQCVENVLGQAAYTLKDVIMERPQDGEEDAELKSLERHNRMMQSLLSLLDSAATLGIGPSLNEFGCKKPQHVDYHMSTLNNRQKMSPNLKGPGVPPHYQTGDLGLVPDPSRTTMPGPLLPYPALAKCLRTSKQDAKLLKQRLLPDI